MSKITFKLAVFEYTSWGNLSSLAGLKVVRKDGDDVSDLIRVSEWKEVKFDAIPIEEVMPEILAALDNEMKQAEKKHNIFMKGLKQKKQEMLAITHEPVVQERNIHAVMDENNYTWRAYYEDTPSSLHPGYKSGYGAKRQDAIDDLKEQERKIKTFMDGDMWCAVYEEGFTNIQECNAGFAKHEQDAISLLKMQDAYDH